MLVTSMFIVHVTPIVKSSLHKLSYFSPSELAVGTIVYVPLRNKEVPALVLATEDARTIKSILRTNLYETKKIREQSARSVLTAPFLRAAERTARHYATSTGSVVESFVPTAILTAADEGEIVAPKQESERHPAFEKLVLQLPRKERLEKYVHITRSNFAQKKSVFLCAPTIREARYIKEQCERGIEAYTYLIESSQSKKKQIETWNAILKEEHPVLVVGTPLFAGIPRNDFGHYILEHEMSSNYKHQKRPRADGRVLIEHLARETGCALVCAGTTVSLATHRSLQEGFATELEEHAKKLRSRASLYVVDSTTVREKARDKKHEFPALAPESIATLRTHAKKGERSFVFAARRGVASHTVCNDCSQTVECHHCGAPVVLHERGNTRYLLCHRCGAARDAHETCGACGSWNLTALGVGIERVESYVRKNLKDVPLFVLSSDTAQTPKQARDIVEEFYKTKGAILLGTELALSYLTEEVACSVMSSIDSLLSVPDFRIEEKVFGIIAMLLEVTRHSLHVETTNISNSMLKHAKSGSLSEYALEELKLRKQLHYPPYVHLVKVSCTGSRDEVIANMEKFVAMTKKYKPRVFGGFVPAQRGSTLHALLRLPTDAWPDKELVPLLESLPMSFTVDVNPEKVL